MTGQIIKVSEDYIYVKTESGGTQSFTHEAFNFEPALYDEVMIDEFEGMFIINLLSKEETQPTNDYERVVEELKVAVAKEVTNKRKVNKVTYALLALFLGGLGIHYFYAGKAFKGILSVLFCWTFIPSTIAFFVGIAALCKEGEDIYV